MTTRWMRWAAMAGAPTLLVAGAISAAARQGSHDPDRSVQVAANASGAARGETPAVPSRPVPTAVPVETTTTTILATSPPPPTQPRPTTTVTVASPTTAAIPLPTVPTTTTQPPRATTTLASGPAFVTVVNSYAEAVLLEVNGQKFDLAVGQRVGPVNVIPAPSGNDGIAVTVKATPTCGIGDGMGYFKAGRPYTLTVTTGPGVCTLNGAKGPDFTVTPT